MVAVVLSTSLVAIAATRGSAASRPYTLAATRSCLLGLPESLSGLPPATPPAPPALFVYTSRHNDIPFWNLGLSLRPPQLGTWYGNRRYEGAILSFFASNAAARGSARALTSLYGGKVDRNVVVSWDEKPAPARSGQRMVLGCLRSESRAQPPEPPRRPAAIATFAGAWGGHTRGLSITRTGTGREDVDDGCCRRAYTLTFRILGVNGTLTRATATYRVLSFRRHERWVKPLRVGEIGRLKLTNGIVTNTLTGVIYCSDPAWGATGACGA